MAVADPPIPAIAEPDVFDYEAAVLAFVNVVRKDLGLEPLDQLLPGSRMRAGKCPIALSIGLDAGRPVTVCSTAVWISYTVWIWGQAREYSREYVTPEEVTYFIRKFDRGEFPEYDSFHVHKLDSRAMEGRMRA